MAEIDSEILISLVMNRPVIWDKTLQIFKDRLATRNAWREVCEELNPSFEELEDKEKNAYGKEVMKRWGNLRDAYAKSKKKIKDSVKSGAANKKLKKYVFNDQLNFLEKLYSTRNTIDSLGGQEENEISTQSVEDGDIDHNTTNKNQQQTTSQPGSRKKKKYDEVELKILKALETPPTKEKDCNMSFFESLLPHLKTFDSNDILQFQIGVLQLISNINDRKKMTTHNLQMFPQHNPAIFPQNNSMLPTVPSFSNHAFSTPRPSSVPSYASLQPVNNYPHTNQNSHQNASEENCRKRPISSLSNLESTAHSPITESCSTYASSQYSFEEVDFADVNN